MGTEIVDKIYHLRENFSIVGLTGRTGAGCTTVANLLKKESFEDLLAPKPSELHDGVSNDERKYRIIYEFAKAKWNPYTVIKASDIIFYFSLMLSYDEFLENLFELGNHGKEKDLIEFRQKFDGIRDEYVQNNSIVNEMEPFLEKRVSYSIRYNKNDPSKKDENQAIVNEVEKYIEFLFNKLPSLRKSIEEIYKEKMNNIFQEWGNNIRLYGSVIENNENNPDGVAFLAKKINAIIKMMEDYNIYNSKPSFFVIDAIRNPYEVLYFRERYGAFYLISVTADEKIRKTRLYNQNYKLDDLRIIDNNEYPSKSKKLRESYTEQDVQKCIELSDYFVSSEGCNIDSDSELKKQIIKFYSLMLHPGLITPSPIERCMQIAYTSKLNSGCLSRRVGAVITDENYSIKAVGWNTVPQGQTPCDLCDFINLYNRTDKNAYSDYEMDNEEFRDFIQKVHEKTKDFEFKWKEKGLPYAFCFKDYYSGLNKNEKNQVHTRSLHAEENAFLQLSKYGSIGIEGGKLFTTASPCELCGKKAYQLGIKEIYYVDIYPGITMKHILSNGINRPKMYFFNGAIGRAYENLYTPMIMLKDEIEDFTGINIKEFLIKKDGEVKK